MAHEEPTDLELLHLLEVAYRAAYRLVGTTQDAEDIAQTAVVDAVTRWNRVASYAEAWTARVAINAAIGQLRRRRRRHHAATPTGSPVAETVALRLDLSKALSGLPRRQREAVALRYVADLSLASVAAAMGISEGAVKTHVHRGIAAVRATLGERFAMTESDPQGRTADNSPEGGDCADATCLKS